MNLLLDTDTCSAVMTGRFPIVRQRFRSAARGGDAIFTSAVVAFELCYGAARSARSAVHEERIRTLLGELPVLDFDSADAREAGIVRATLEAMGLPIGAYDVMLAGQARRRGLALVTGNVREFARVPGLGVENWFA